MRLPLTCLGSEGGMGGGGGGVLVLHDCTVDLAKPESEKHHYQHSSTQEARITTPPYS